MMKIGNNCYPEIDIQSQKAAVPAADQSSEVKDRKLLKATPIERKRLIFADNSYDV